MNTLGLVMALAAQAFAGGCIGVPACVETGTSKLLVPEARLSKVTSITTSGVCTVEALPTACTPGVVCGESAKGVRVVVLVVSASKQGKCTVTITYNDGCASEEVPYEFGGSYGSCCEDVCAKSKLLEPVSAHCPTQ